MLRAVRTPKENHPVSDRARRRLREARSERLAVAQRLRAPHNSEQCGTAAPDALGLFLRSCGGTVPPTGVRTTDPAAAPPAAAATVLLPLRVSVSLLGGAARAKTRHGTELGKVLALAGDGKHAAPHHQRRVTVHTDRQPRQAVVVTGPCVRTSALYAHTVPWQHERRQKIRERGACGWTRGFVLAARG